MDVERADRRAWHVDAWTGGHCTGPSSISMYMMPRARHMENATCARAHGLGTRGAEEDRGEEAPKGAQVLRLVLSRAWALMVYQAVFVVGV